MCMYLYGMYHHSLNLSVYIYTHSYKHTTLSDTHASVLLAQVSQKKGGRGGGGGEHFLHYIYTLYRNIGVLARVGESDVTLTDVCVCGKVKQ
jgi:hypothetical protein